MLAGLLPVGILAIHADNPLLSLKQMTAVGAISVFLMLWGTTLLFRKFKFARFLLTAGVLLNDLMMIFEYMHDPLLTMFFAACNYCIDLLPLHRENFSGQSAFVCIAA